MRPVFDRHCVTRCVGCCPPGAAPGKNCWYVQCWKGGVQNATFVSSADSRLTRSAGELGIVSRFSSLRAKLCAGSPRLLTVLTAISLVIGRCCCSAADETVKLALVSHGTATPTNANKVSPKPVKVVKPAAADADSDTNTLTLSFDQPSVSTSLSAATTDRASERPHSPGVTVVHVKKRPAPGGLLTRQPGNGNFGFANIEAGYGQAYDADSVVLRGRNGTANEETRYLFFKKVVKF